MRRKQGLRRGQSSPVLSQYGDPDDNGIEFYWDRPEEERSQTVQSASPMFSELATRSTVGCSQVEPTSRNPCVGSYVAQMIFTSVG